jgi:tetratricopeptide (TPR) repeat protein
MKKDTSILPLNFYYEHLTEVNGVKFTPREIDVISCILNGRTAAIAEFLSIGKRAVERYVSDIRQKAGGLAGRDHIINFIERSGKISLIKNEYYPLLRLRVLFEEGLKRITQKLGIRPSLCLITYEKGEKYPPYIIPYLKEHLKHVGFTVKVGPRPKDLFLHRPNDLMNAEQTQGENQSVLYLLPENGSHSHLRKIDTAYLSKLVVVCCGDSNSHEEKNKPLKDSCFVNILGEKNYYFSFFEILKLLFPRKNFDDVLEEFGQQYGSMVKEAEVISPRQDLDERQAEDASQLAELSFLQGPLKNITSHYLFSVSNLASNRKNIFFLIIAFATVAILSLAYLPMRERLGKVLPPINPAEPLVRSDLIIPNEAALLNRPKFIKEIDDKFKDQKGIRTIALIGTGGAGKTTLARLYVRSQNVPLIWEINAETHEGLVRSFEDLAHALSKTNADKKNLQELQEVMDPEKKENRLLSFVKEKLKDLSSWFLIYDNVEDFPSIQNYFPRDGGTWGQGKVILTTRNRNIQNNKHVNRVVFIEQLNDQQKLDLFSKIMYNGNKISISSTDIEENKEFLKAIPSFPLDVSVAAYYIKSTNISHKDYLEGVENPSQRFIDVQTDILKDTSDYVKTRYGIITLSLQRLLNIDKDFIELLLLISFLDSQNIPRELLEAHKDKNVVDSFVYNLKKYSLISGSFSPATATFSIHRSTQAISLAYLTQKLKLTENSSYIQSVSNALKQYMNEVRDKKNYRELEILAAHCKAFLSHHLLTNDDRGVISRSLGHIYTYLGQHIRAKKILETSLNILQQSKKKNYIEIFQTAVFVANSDRKIGQYRKAKDLLEQNLSLYQHYLPENHRGLPQAFLILGMIYWELGDYEKAKPLLEKSLNLYEKYHSDRPLKAPWALIHLGAMEKQLGHYKKAKLLLEKGLVGYQNTLPENHLYLVGPLLLLGSLYEDIGEYDKAKDLLEQCFRIQANDHSENQVCAAWIGGHLGNIYTKLEKHEKAQALLTQSLLLYQKHLPENTRYINWVLVSLGDAYKGSGNYKEAKGLLEKALIAYEKYYGNTHIETARVINSLGHVSLLEGNLETAESLLNRAFQIFEHNKHPDIYICLETSSELYQKKSEQADKAGLTPQAQVLKGQAQHNLKQALEIVKTHFPIDSAHRKRIEQRLKGMVENQKSAG